MPELIYNLKDPKTGRTYRQENLEIEHKIPLGTLVEVRFDRWYGGGACAKIRARLFVVRHVRDCDGTPLYTLSGHPVYDPANTNLYSGFLEDSLRVIKITDAILDGDDTIEWGEGDA